VSIFDSWGVKSLRDEIVREGLRLDRGPTRAQCQGCRFTRSRASFFEVERGCVGERYDVCRNCRKTGRTPKAPHGRRKP